MPTLQSVEVRIDDEPMLFHPTDPISFGRGGSVLLDHDGVPDLVGTFEPTVDGWQLTSNSDHPLELHHSESESSLTLASGQSAPVFFSEASLSFWIGRARFGFEIRLIDQWSALPIRLNVEQRQLLVGLASTQLTGTSDRLPRNCDLALQLGWSRSKLNRKLDQLCKKFADRGVSGLHGSPDRLASRRRQVLVDHVLKIGLITRDDISLLASVADPPTPDVGLVQ